MPAPMMAPTPSAVRLTGPSTRRSPCSPSVSARRTCTGLVANSCSRNVISVLFLPGSRPGAPPVTGLPRRCNALASERGGDRCVIALLERQRDRAWTPRADATVVQPHHRQHLHGRGGDEHLRRAPQPGDRDALLAH